MSRRYILITDYPSVVSRIVTKEELHTIWVGACQHFKSLIRNEFGGLGTSPGWQEYHGFSDGIAWTSVFARYLDSFNEDDGTFDLAHFSQSNTLEIIKDIKVKARSSRKSRWSKFPKCRIFDEEDEKVKDEDVEPINNTSNNDVIEDDSSLSDIELDYRDDLDYISILSDLCNGIGDDESYSVDFTFSLYNLKFHSWCPEGCSSKEQFYFLAREIPINKDYILAYQTDAIHAGNDIQFLNERPSLQQKFIDNINKILAHIHQYSHSIIKLYDSSGMIRQFNQDDGDGEDHCEEPPEDIRGYPHLYWEFERRTKKTRLTKKILQFVQEGNEKIECIYMEYTFDSGHYWQWKVILI